MPEPTRRLASALAVAVTALVLTSVSGAPAHADDPQPILPLPPIFTPPTPTPAPTTPAAPTPSKTSSPSKQSSSKPAKHKATHTKAKKKAHGTATSSSSTTTTSSTTVSAPTAASSAPTVKKAKAEAKPAAQVAAPNFRASTPVQPVKATSQAAPTVDATLMSDTASDATGSALSLWVPVGILAFFAALSAATLRYRRRTGGV